MYCVLFYTEIQAGQQFSQKYILKDVAEQIACEWHDIGIHLGVNVDNIEKEHNPTKAKFEEMMSTWLRNQTDSEPAIYKTIYEALMATDLVSAAENFRGKVQMQIDIN